MATSRTRGNKAENRPNHDHAENQSGHRSNPPQEGRLLVDVFWLGVFWLGFVHVAHATILKRSPSQMERSGGENRGETRTCAFARGGVTLRTKAVPENPSRW